jgi:3-deoxy-D-manno-octulosonic-acid transferase
MYFVYTVLGVVWLFLMLPVFIYRAIRFQKYREGLLQRLGRFPLSLKHTGEPTIWIHACSVGETLSVQALAKVLDKRCPGTRFVFSTVTKTGQEIARIRFAKYGEGRTFYLPLDLPFVMRRALEWMKPDLFITIDTEIWPNLLRQAAKRKIPVVMVNGRISNESFPRYRMLRRWMKPVLDHYDLLLMKSSTDYERILEIGASPEKTIVTGNIKYDKDTVERVISDAQAEAILASFNLDMESDLVLVAGSTHEGEEEILLEVFRRLREEDGLEEVRLMLVPRHPERFDEVTELVKEKGFRVKRRTEPPVGGEKADVLILDTLGELAGAYEFATVVFVGKTLVPWGGQSVMEPALYAKPIVVGASMTAFPGVAADFLAGKAMLQLTADHKNPKLQEQQLFEAFKELLQSPERREELGAAAEAVLDQSRGTTRHTVDQIAKVYPRILPDPQTSE